MATFQLQLNLGKLDLAFNQSYTTIIVEKIIFLNILLITWNPLATALCVQSAKHAVFSKRHSVYALQFLYQYQMYIT